MKRLIYLTYLSLLILFLLSCQKENVLPAQDGSMEMAGTNLKKPVCTSYSFSTKTGVVNLGSIWTDNILVVFERNATQAQKRSILSGYQIYKEVVNKPLSEALDTMYVVQLKPNATCVLVENMLTGLNNNSLVKNAIPTFDGYQFNMLWVSTTNEMFVALNDPADHNQLVQLVLATNTEIVEDWGGGLYTIGINKNPTSNILAIVSQFNAASFISEALPNYYFQRGSGKGKKLSEVKKEALAGR